MSICCLTACLILSYSKEIFTLASTPNIDNIVATDSSGRAITAGLLNGNNIYGNEDSNDILKLSSDLNGTEFAKGICSSMKDLNDLTQTELITQLTAPSRYDRLERPHVFANNSFSNDPVEIYVRIDTNIFENLGTSYLEFKAHGFIQLRFNDPRLKFANCAQNRTQSIIGGSYFRTLIWVPHILLGNEMNTNIVGRNDEDILIAISPNGNVLISSRIQWTLYCWKKLHKFPFGEQFCLTVIKSWMYNSSDLLLQWEQNAPVGIVSKMGLSKYTLRNIWMNDTVTNAHLSFEGNYSSLSFTVRLTREVANYIIEYFLPSIMIVAISWVSFWLQPDQTPARTTLGCTTLLSLITLASTEDRSNTKVRYAKISEAWYLGCTCFIFGSLVEFAYVNSVWRRKRNIEVKKINCKDILKGILTPNAKLHKMVETVNCKKRTSLLGVREQYHSMADSAVIIKINDRTASNIISADQTKNPCGIPKEKEYDTNNCCDTMTPQEVSLWIDKKARFLFPLAFIVFNALFWAFVYCL